MVNKSKKRVRKRDFRRAFTKGFEHGGLNLTLLIFIIRTEKMLYLRRLRLLIDCLFILPKGLDMCNDVLRNAAIVFCSLLRYKYHIVLGRKGKAEQIDIRLLPEVFFCSSNCFS